MAAPAEFGSMYEALKLVHVGCVIASGSGFVARGALMLAGSTLLATRFVRVAPHALDTLLLASAVAMAVLYIVGAALTRSPLSWLAGA